MRGPLRDFRRTRKGRERTWHAVEMRFPRGLFFGFDVFPVRERLSCAVGGLRLEDVWMTPDQLFSNPTHDLGHRERSRFNPHLGDENDFEEKVAELFANGFRVVLTDSVHELVGFFEHEGPPRTPSFVRDPRGIHPGREASPSVQ